jgi:hypothetical protein
MVVYRVTSAMSIVRCRNSVEVGHINVGRHAFPLDAFAIVIIVEVVYVFVCGRLLIWGLILLRLLRLHLWLWSSLLLLLPLLLRR